MLGIGGGGRCRAGGIFGTLGVAWAASSRCSGTRGFGKDTRSSLAGGGGDLWKVLAFGGSS